MPEFIDALTHHEFLRNALLAGMLASIACGISGTYVVVKRIGYLAGGISHAVLGGIGGALYLGYDPMSGALTAALVSAFLVGWVHLRSNQNEDTLISAIWAVGMAGGILFMSRTSGYNADLVSYLFGNILMVSRKELYYMAVADLGVMALVYTLYRPFLAVTFDEEHARLRGVRVDVIYMVLLMIVGLTVVLLIQIVGLILIIALLALPAAIASQYARSLSRIMVLAVILGWFFSVCGLAIAYRPDFPAGATIVMIAGLGYLLSTAFQAVRSRSA